MSTQSPSAPRPASHRALYFWVATLFIMTLMAWWPAFAMTRWAAPQAASAPETRTEAELIRFHRESTLTGMALLTAHPSLDGPTTAKDTR